MEGRSNAGRGLGGGVSLCKWQEVTMHDSIKTRMHCILPAGRHLFHSEDFAPTLP